MYFRYKLDTQNVSLYVYRNTLYMYRDTTQEILLIICMYIHVHIYIYIYIYIYLQDCFILIAPSE